tara:strand:+ start:201 stop:1235 length:1035 start_codon:yes stop_codon:yes gene_type:complete
MADNFQFPSCSPPVPFSLKRQDTLPDKEDNEGPLEITTEEARSLAPSPFDVSSQDTLPDFPDPTTEQIADERMLSIDQNLVDDIINNAEEKNAEENNAEESETIWYKDFNSDFYFKVEEENGKIKMCHSYVYLDEWHETQTFNKNELTFHKDRGYCIESSPKLAGGDFFVHFTGIDRIKNFSDNTGFGLFVTGHEDDAPYDCKLIPAEIFIGLTEDEIKEKNLGCLLNGNEEYCLDAIHKVFPTWNGLFFHKKGDSKYGFAKFKDLPISEDLWYCMKNHEAFKKEYLWVDWNDEEVEVLFFDDLDYFCNFQCKELADLQTPTLSGDPPFISHIYESYNYTTCYK